MKKIAVVGLSSLLLFVIIGPQLSRFDFESPQAERLLLPPNSQEIFGTDSLGRDFFSRVLWGGRISLGFTAINSLLSVALGVLIGASVGLLSTRWNRWVLRGFDLFQAIPSFVTASVLCLSLLSFLRFLEPEWRTILSLNLAIVFTHWAVVARQIRAEVLQVREEPFVAFAKTLGASRAQIFRFHLWPALRSRVGLLLALQIPTNLFYESFLSFTGFGVQPPYTSWGLLVQEGWRNINTHPHLILIPMFLIVTTVWSLNVIFLKKDKTGPFECW